MVWLTDLEQQFLCGIKTQGFLILNHGLQLDSSLCLSNIFQLNTQHSFYSEFHVHCLK